MNAKKILIVEDNSALADAIYEILYRKRIYQLFVANDLKTMQKTLLEEHIDLIILDRMLGNEDSIEHIEWIQQHSKNSKIIFLSVKGSPRDRVEGLKLGADDYLAKPFDIEELLLRITKLLQTSSTAMKNEVFSFGGNEINFQTGVAQNGKKETLVLSGKEKNILYYFLTHPRSLVSREALFQEIWGTTYNPKSRIIDNHILKFRKFFEPSPENPQYFIAKRSGGYMFVHP